MSCHELVEDVVAPLSRQLKGHTRLLQQVCFNLKNKETYTYVAYRFLLYGYFLTIAMLFSNKRLVKMSYTLAYTVLPQPFF